VRNQNNGSAYAKRTCDTVFVYSDTNVGVNSGEAVIKNQMLGVVINGTGK
jgi:hypothetical protein